MESDLGICEAKHCGKSGGGVHVRTRVDQVTSDQKPAQTQRIIIFLFFLIPDERLGPTKKADTSNRHILFGSLVFGRKWACL